MDEALIWLPALAILLLVSSQTGINGHFRYALPAFPFLFIAVSRVGRLWETLRASRLKWVAVAGIAACLLWNAVEVVRYHPHHLSYFNPIAGGPDNGWKWLAESNIDWGQDLLFLKKWLDDHPEAAESLRLAYYGGVPPHLLGVSKPPIRWDDGPRPGWYAVSANAVTGMAFFCRQPDGQRVYYPLGAFRFFEEFKPEAKAGYSIFIYQLTPDDVNAARSQLGLPPLSAPESATSK